MPRINSENFYISAIEKHGITPKGLNWTSQDTQEIRFENLFKLLPDTIDSLIDVGCGFGDLYFYIQNKNLKVNNYQGIDSLHTMCQVAQQRTSANIIHADATKANLPKAHYYLCSGALNILHPYEAHLFIRNCFHASTKGFVFNTLYGDKQSDTYNYMTDKQLQNIASSLNVKRVAYKDNYIHNDITVGFFHV